MPQQPTVVKSRSPVADLFGRRPYLLALAVVLALVVWMASGRLRPEAAPEARNAAEPTAPTFTTVRVRTFRAEPVKRTLTLYGRTEPDRLATLKAETEGRVAEVLARRGARVRTGDPILRLAMRDRRERLAHARKLLEQKRIEFDGVQTLNVKGYQGKVRLAEVAAQLEEARAAIARLELEIENTVIRAPFDGILAERHAEVGDYLAVGDPAAVVVDLDPLVVRADVTQADVGGLAPGRPVRARLMDGRGYEGSIRFVSSIADESTNTFRVEAAFDNPDLALPAGMSAELAILLEETLAVRISPALLALDEAGDLGVKWVDGNEVRFTPIDLVKSDAEGAWVAGLGETVDLITVGQAFVRAGDRVQPVFEGAAGR